MTEDVQHAAVERAQAAVLRPQVADGADGAEGASGSAAYQRVVDRVLTDIGVRVVDVPCQPPRRVQQAVNLLRGRPANALPAGRRALRAHAPDAICVVVNSLRSYRPAVELAERDGLPLLYVSYNVESGLRARLAGSGLNPRRIPAMIDAKATTRVERMISRRSIGVTAITDADCTELSDRFGVAAIHLPPLTLAQLTELESSTDELPPFERRQDSIAIFGSSTWKPKERSFIDLLAHVSTRTQLHFALIGNHSPKVIRFATERCSNVEVVGRVSDPVDVLRTYRWGVMHEPFGAGFPTRVIDLVAAGTPVFSTVAAARGLRPSPFIRRFDHLPALLDELARTNDDTEGWNLSCRARLSCLPTAEQIEAGAEQLSALMSTIARRRPAG